MAHAIVTRLGDGSRVEMTRSEIRSDIEDGVAAAVKRAKVAPLTPDEVDHLVDIFTSSARFSAVDVGDEVVLSSDGTCSLGVGLAGEQVRVYQDSLGADILELATADYSYKAVKTVITSESHEMKLAQLATVAPLQYGAMPDLGRYSQPDGPIANWSELMPLGRIDEARAAQEEALEMAVDDMVYCADHLWAAGADGLDFDTAGASGDADLLATLRAVETLRERYPDIGLQVGMAAEMVLGMHGELEYKGRRLAGMWPQAQMEVVQEAGATIFGPAVNVNTTKSVAWNTARACTLIKPCMDGARIPVHPNVGMGVCGVPMSGSPPHDAVSRAACAMVEILKIDGLQTGVGDVLGMHASHAIAAGMGGVRTAGDLVARMQVTRGMRLEAAKDHVSAKLGVSPDDLSDPLVMHEVRRELGVGFVATEERVFPDEPGGIEAKFNISRLLDVTINSVERFRRRAGL